VGHRTDSVISLFGPTAVGKTSVALGLAEVLAAEGKEVVAVSADAFQLYRGLELLSGAPSAAVMNRLPHLLVGSHDVCETMSAGRFADEAHEAIDTALDAGRQPVVIGGSGLYMQAALTDLEMRPPVANGTAAGPAEEGDVYGQLKELAPQAAAQIDPADHYRAGRALALAQAGDRPEPGESFWDAPLRHPTIRFGLVRDREELYRRIDERVDEMVAAGAGRQVEAVIEAASPTARKIIGFDELPAGEIDAMKLRTRRYAKRQMTWTRRLPGARLIDLSVTSDAEAARRIANSLLKRAE
jgi:tRNA dimethylallyltransferase